MKIDRKLAATFCAVVLMAVGIGISQVGEIKGASSAGNSISTALGISMDTKYSGEITTSNTDDYYKFSLSTSGTVTFTAQAYISDGRYTLYDEDGEELWAENFSWNETTEVSNFSEDLVLTSGTYYILVSHYYMPYSTLTGGGYGEYNIKLTFESSGETFKESNGGNNNSIQDADSISVGTTYKGQLALNDTDDYYAFSIEKSGTVTLTGKEYISNGRYTLYDEDGEELWAENFSWNETSGVSNHTEELVLTSGTYYILVSHYYIHYSTLVGGGYGNYSLKLTFSSSGESFAEKNGGNNNTMSSADSISLNKKYKGQLALNDSEDWYSFKVTGSYTIRIKSVAGIEKVTYKIFDSDGNEIWESTKEWNETSGKLNLKEDVELSAGQYYLAVIQKSDYGNYNITIKINPGDITLYDENIKAGKRKIKVSWSKVKGVKYQVSYRIKGKKKWKKTKAIKKKSKVLKKLKSGKKYQIRVRTVKKVNKVTYYGDWSEKKTVKVK